MTSSYRYKANGKQEFARVYDLLFLASVHGFMYETNIFFYSLITFSYTKCFVHSYTVDVVFTLSYGFSTAFFHYVTQYILALSVQIFIYTIHRKYHLIHYGHFATFYRFSCRLCYTVYGNCITGDEIAISVFLFLESRPLDPLLSGRCPQYGSFAWTNAVQYFINIISRRITWLSQTIFGEGTCVRYNPISVS